MEPEKPLHTLEELRKTSPDGHKLITHIIFNLCKQHWQNDPRVRYSGIGLEAYIEGSEELINVGLLKVMKDGDRYFFSVFDVETGEYSPR